MKISLSEVITFLLTLFLANPVFSMDFEEVWLHFYKNSHEMESIRKDEKAAELSLERAGLHWLPKISLMAQWIDTNDPGQVLFNTLGQRSMKATDFVPSSLNYPDRKQFINGLIGLELPFYEGGLRVGEHSMLASLLQASRIEKKARQTEIFSDLAKKYGSIIVYQQNLFSLKKLKHELDKIISSYQIGSRNNPLGHSGLLGLKGLSNRIQGLFIVFEQELDTSKNWISSKAGLNQDWSIEENSISDYVRRHLDIDPTVIASSLLSAQEFKVTSLDYVSHMEKARYLPQVGLFAQNQLYSGDRNTENIQAFGLYLRWELFNSDSFNRSAVARAKAMSAKAKLRSSMQEETLMRSKLMRAKEALEINLELLESSSSYLTEQTRNSMRLFRSGQLNALQLAEVINRRVDLLEQKNSVELQYLDIRMALYKLTH